MAGSMYMTVFELSGAMLFGSPTLAIPLENIEREHLSTIVIICPEYWNSLGVTHIKNNSRTHNSHNSCV